MIPRNNFQVIQKFIKLHSVLCSNWRKFTAYIGLGFQQEKKNVKSTKSTYWVQLNNILSCFHEIFLQQYCYFTLHSVVKWKIYSHWKNISSNHLFSNFFSKTAFSRIVGKNAREYCGKSKIYSPRKNISSN